MNRTTILLVVALASCGCRRLPTPAPVATASEPRHDEEDGRAVHGLSLIHISEPTRPY